MNTDIIQLVKDALQHMGCPLSVMSNIDANSPIVFSFNNGVVMHLVMVEDDVWLWAPITEFSEKMLTQNGAKFLTQIMQPYPFFVTGKTHLSNEEGKLILQGLVNEKSLEKAEYFAAALQVFFDITLKLRGITQE